MISAILFDSDEKELNKIKDLVSDAVSMLTDDEIRFCACSGEKDLEKALQTMDLCDVVIAEFGENGSAIDRIRARFATAPLLLAVDVTVSPMKYIRPGIMPSGLILRPLSDEDLEKNISEFLTASLDIRNTEDETQIMVETKKGNIKVPISQVFYFESKAKKVYLRLRNEEYGYYDTLEHLETVLPGNFLRCHRGIIVNMDYVTQYKATEKTLYLEGDMFIPVSRRYNADVRGRMKNE